MCGWLASSLACSLALLTLVGFFHTWLITMDANGAASSKMLQRIIEKRIEEELTPLHFYMVCARYQQEDESVEKTHASRKRMKGMSSVAGRERLRIRLKAEFRLRLRGGGGRRGTPLYFLLHCA